MERWNKQRCQTLLNIHILQRINSYFVGGFFVKLFLEGFIPLLLHNDVVK